MSHSITSLILHPLQRAGIMRDPMAMLILKQDLRALTPNQQPQIITLPYHHSTRPGQRALGGFFTPSSSASLADVTILSTFHHRLFSGSVDYGGWERANTSPSCRPPRTRV